MGQGRRPSWAIVAALAGGLALGLAAVFAWSGLGLRDAGLLAAVLAANIAAGGSLLAMWLRRRVCGAEVLGGGVAVALVWLMAIGLVARSDLVVWLSLPLLAVAAWSGSAVWPATVRAPQIEWRPASLAAGAFATLVALALNRYQWERYRLTSPVDYSTFHPDNLFLQVVGTASHASGTGTGGLSDWPLRYHWLSYAMSAGLESVTDSAAFAGLTRALPVVAIVGLAFLAAGWAARSASPTWVAWLAALMVVAGRLVGDPTIVPVNWDSLSQTVSGPILVLACYLAVYLPARRTDQLAVAFFAISFVLTGTKVSAAPVLVCTVAMLTVVGYVRRAPRRHATLAVAVACVAGAVVAFVLLESGQADGGGLGLRDVSGGAALWTSLQPTLATTLAVLPGWAGLGYLAARPVRRWSRMTAAGVGLAIAGLGPLWLMAESRPNSTWFLVSATTCAWVISAVGAGRAVRRSLPVLADRRRVVVAAAVVAVVTAAVWAAAVRASDRLALAVVAQVWFLVLLAIAAGVAVWVLRRRGVAHAAVPLVVAAATMSVVAAVLASRIGAVPTPTPTADSTATVYPGEVRTPLSPAEVDALSRQLVGVARAGDIVAYRDSGVMPALFAARLVPYATQKRLSTSLSIAGSEGEFDARRRTIDGALDGDPAAVQVLCDAGVRWLVGSVDRVVPDLPPQLTVAADAAGFRVLRLTCAS